MLTLLMFAVCLLVILQGGAVMQVALAACEPTRNWRTWVMLIGVIGFILGVVGGVALAVQWMAKVDQIGNLLKQF